MWVLLQFISGSIQKNALADFLPVMKLFDLLYPEKEVRFCQEAVLVYYDHYYSCPIVCPRVFLLSVVMVEVFFL